MPFLEVLTRCHKRPKMLAVNRASLAAQTCDDWTQTLLVDDIGIGIGAATERMAAYAPRLVGNYVWMLDDDDTCIMPDFVEGLRFIVADSDPDVIFVRMDHGSGRILPDRQWGHAPQCGEIGISAFVVRREVWQAHAGAMIPGKYTSDFEFISSIYQSFPLIVYWWDVVASKVQRQSLGDAE